MRFWFRGEREFVLGHPLFATGQSVALPFPVRSRDRATAWRLLLHHGILKGASLLVQPSDLTIEILKGIRDEVRITNARLDETNTQLGAFRSDANMRLDRLERRQTEGDVRVQTEVAAVVGAVDRLRDVLLEDRALRQRVDDHERRLVAIESHAG